MILTIYVTLGASLVSNSACYKLPLHLTWGLSIDMKVEELRTAHAFLGSIPGFERSPGEGNGYPLQYSALETPWTVESMVGLESK